jgi:hypothetical protein
MTFYPVTSWVDLVFWISYGFVGIGLCLIFYELYCINNRLKAIDLAHGVEKKAKRTRQKGGEL